MTCDQAVRDYLTTHKGCQRDICKATGYCKTAVGRSVRKLRWGKSPLLANLRDGRLLPVPKPKPKPRMIAESLSIMASAINERTPLEVAWS